MTKPDLQINQQIDEMRARLIENAQNEQLLSDRSMSNYYPRFGRLQLSTKPGAVTF
jgi:hypothetical protein